jgi:FtsZ-binding cell division protein ZapB
MLKKNINEKIDSILDTVNIIKIDVAVLKQINTEVSTMQSKCDKRVETLETEADELKSQMSKATGIGIGIGIVATLLSILGGAKAFGII